MLLPLTFLSFTLWKPRHFGSLVFPAMKLSLWASHSLTAGWSVVFLSSTVSSPASPPSALSAICLHQISTGHSRSANNPLLVKPPKSRITAHLHSFIPLFPRLWNKLPHSIQSHSSLQAFKTAVHHHLLYLYEVYTSYTTVPSLPHPNPRSFLPPLIHPKPTSFKFPAFLHENPCNVHLVFPMVPTPSRSLPQIS